MEFRLEVASGELDGQLSGSTVETSTKDKNPVMGREEWEMEEAKRSYSRDARALDEIQALLSGKEWTPEDLEGVASIVAATGRVIEDYDPEGDYDPEFDEEAPTNDTYSLAASLNRLDDGVTP